MIINFNERKNDIQKENEKKEAVKRALGILAGLNEDYANEVKTSKNEQNLGKFQLIYSGLNKDISNIMNFKKLEVQENPYQSIRKNVSRLELVEENLKDMNHDWF